MAYAQLASPLEVQTGPSPSMEEVGPHAVHSDSTGTQQHYMHMHIYDSTHQQPPPASGPKRQTTRVR
mgnify:CR=1